MSKIPKQLPTVSVIILNYNGLQFAEGCVRSVLNSDYPDLDVVIVDNGSTDGSYKILRRSFGSNPKVRILRNRRNLGFAQGNNFGYFNSKGDIVVFLNVDTRAKPDWLLRLVSALESDDGVGGAQSKLLDMKREGTIDSVGSFMDYLGYVYPCRSESYDRDREIFYTDGAAMAFKRKVLAEVAFDGSPFDPSYFLYYEDSDLCWRIRLRGYRIRLASSSVVYHYRGGAGARSLDFRRTFFFTRSQVLTIVKNYELPNLSCFLTALFFVEVVQSIMLLRKEPRRALAKLGALLWCIRNLRSIWAKRLFVQARVRRVSDREAMRHMIKPNLLAARRSSRAFY